MIETYYRDEFDNAVHVSEKYEYLVLSNTGISKDMSNIIEKYLNSGWCIDCEILDHSYLVLSRRVEN